MKSQCFLSSYKLKAKDSANSVKQLYKITVIAISKLVEISTLNSNNFNKKNKHYILTKVYQNQKIRKTDERTNGRTDEKILKIIVLCAKNDF